MSTQKHHAAMELAATADAIAMGVAQAAPALANFLRECAEALKSADMDHLAMDALRRGVCDTLWICEAGWLVGGCEHTWMGSEICEAAKPDPAEAILAALDKSVLPEVESTPRGRTGSGSE